MRLLQAQEREITVKKDEYKAKKLASDMAEEVNSLIKSFNKTRTEVEEKSKKLLGEHHKHEKLLQEELLSVEEDLKEKKILRDKVLSEALKVEKEMTVRKEALMERESLVAGRDVRNKAREEELKELEQNFKESIRVIGIKEKELIHRENHLVEREDKFAKFMKGQKLLFEQNEQRLRDWLEKERAKVRNYGTS